MPGVLLFVSAYALVKLVNYSLFFWLLYFLDEGPAKLTGSGSASLARLFDVGYLIGGMLLGFVTDV